MLVSLYIIFTPSTLHLFEGHNNSRSLPAMPAINAAYTFFFSILLGLFFLQCLAEQLIAHLRVDRQIPGVGPVLAEVRFFIANEDACYVTLYQRRSATFVRGAVWANLALWLLKFLFPSMQKKGRFETRVLVEQRSIASPGFWSPNLCESCLTAKGRLMWRRITHCPGVSGRERSKF
jgi:hypothetical protein